MNYIARYALAVDTYLVSEGGRPIVASYPIPFQRRWLDKQRGTFEHLVPVSVVRDLLRDSDREESTVRSILHRSAAAALVSKG